jgi:lysophospholipase L1-like esterase
VRELSCQAKLILNNFIEKFNKLHPESRYKFFNYSLNNILDWIDADVRQMVAILNKRNIKVIIQNYPPVMPLGQRFIKGVNETLKKVAIDTNVPFVDNEQVFLKLMHNPGNWKDYFNDTLEGGGHCNANGYRIMAENVYTKIKEESMLK